jgi:hypothetical protein
MDEIVRVEERVDGVMVSFSRQLHHDQQQNHPQQQHFNSPPLSNSSFSDSPSPSPSAARNLSLAGEGKENKK